ncbi:unnamed protein product [Moneuplotes crassus]|uniref:Uncharacterized protein n=1 Tax=Euplotes crassus TaxID=5936 RepID=A0AAD1UCG7_EUPCR|nr:unnamed protein product [Moneuplotes crassus]
MIQSVFPPNNKSDTLFSRSGKSKMHTIFKQLEKDQEEEDNYHAKPTGHVEQMCQRMGLWHRSQSQNQHDEGDDNISHDQASIVADKQSPSKFKLRSQSKPFRFRKSKLTSSFVSEPREANFQRVQKQLNSTMPGKYNLKYNSTEKKVLGASFGKIGAKIHKRLHASTEHSPICEKVVKALNSSPKKQWANRSVYEQNQGQEKFL